MNKVLIALDYNQSAKTVAEIGNELAIAMNAEVVLLHIILDQLYYSTTDQVSIMGFNGFIDSAQIPMETTEDMKNISQNFLDKTKLHLGNKSIKTIVRDGDFAETILATAEEEKVNLIVLGTHSHKWIESIILGSVAEKVLQLSSIPLFIVPTKV